MLSRLRALCVPRLCLLIRTALLVAWMAAISCPSAMAQNGLDLPQKAGAKPKNVIFILIDDLRWDVFSFAGHPFVKTPKIDALAKGGVHFQNAFVTTSLCSPSRASILTGKYMHNHGIVDNNNPGSVNNIYFPQYLQQAGYQTAFIGKWHMGGGNDEPRPGFNHWVSFRGQGHYNSPGPRWTLNVDGKSVPQKGYITDELTDYAVNWLEGRDPNKPFFLYLSHKAVHADFEPAERHKDLYKDVDIQLPKTRGTDPAENQGVPMWVQNQRNSWHGVEFPYHSKLDIRDYFRRYCQALAAVDDSVGRVMIFLEENNLKDDTVVMFMGDNGFLFGEHGLIDKRNAYEESMRVPLIVQGPGFEPNTKIESVVANIDIGPTVLDLAGLATAEDMDGQSFLGLATGDMKPDAWRKELMYEYYWEWNFPHTPTVFALRTDDFKFIEYHGIWDTDELYDLRSDPEEKNNLIHSTEYQQIARELRGRLNTMLEESDAMTVPFTAKRGDGANLRNRDGSKAAEFPESVLRGTDER